MKNVYTIQQVNAYIKNMFQQDFMLNRIYIKGEVSNCKYHSSGHIYFSLKDHTGTITCVMFAGQRSGLAFQMKDGQSVIVLGNIQLYEQAGRHQLYATQIMLDGVGALHEKFQQLKSELEEMGMFAPEYKLRIPKYVKTIGIVTAPTGAAIRDMVQVTQRRNPFVQVILYPALVQGTGAAESIVKGIQALEGEAVDVIIVGRGGGSLEDLWAFNEEIVARAVFACSVPIISAVGHETDTTIIDYVADLRAPTPSAAAELAVFEYQKVMQQLQELRQQLQSMIQQRVKYYQMAVKQYELQISHKHPIHQIREQKQKAMDAKAEMQQLVEQSLERSKHRLQLLIERMKGLSPLEKMGQGYSYVETDKKQNIKSVSQVRKKDRLKIYVLDGTIDAEVQGVIEEKIDERKDH